MHRFVAGSIKRTHIAGQGIAMPHDHQTLFTELIEHVTELSEFPHKAAVVQTLWQALIELHPADIAEFFMLIDTEQAYILFRALPRDTKPAVFAQLSEASQASLFNQMAEDERQSVIKNLSLDDVSDLFDELSDEDVEKYLKLLQRSERAKVMELLQFDENTAGGMMTTDVLTLVQTITVAKTIQILQRFQPDRELHRRIYLVDRREHLVGHILLEDLVLKKPQDRLQDIMRENEYVAYADQDREEVAKQMMHYDVTNAPVVDRNNVFLGVISSADLIEVLEEEASENIFRMATMSPIKNTYFETPFLKLLTQRSSILLVLLFAQSLSSMIMQRYEHMLAGFLMYFITMLISTGGNASSQTSALVIQGLATGEISSSNTHRFIKREAVMACVMATILGVFSFIRVYASYHYAFGSFVVSLALAAIVLISVLLGSTIPLILNRLNVDPAHSAGPLLATLMDIVGLITYCYISSFFFA